MQSFLDDFLNFQNLDTFWTRSGPLKPLLTTKSLQQIQENQGTSLEIEFYSYDSNDIEDLMILFLWLPPIIFVVGLGMMIYNKKSQMVAGASAAVLPAIIITAIISSIIFEILY